MPSAGGGRCGRRRGNETLVRESADGAPVERQLDILPRRGVRGVAVLTGEYRRGSLRREMIAHAARALRAALARGFRHVLVNIGSLDAGEFDDLLADVARDAEGRIAPPGT